MPTVCKHGENARACVVCKDDEIERLRTENARLWSEKEAKAQGYRDALEMLKASQRLNSISLSAICKHSEDVLSLRAALEKYGRHAHPNCHDLVGPSARVRHGCLCGLDAALAGAAVPASESRPVCRRCGSFVDSRGKCRISEHNA